MTSTALIESARLLRVKIARANVEVLSGMRRLDTRCKMQRVQPFTGTRYSGPAPFDTRDALPFLIDAASDELAAALDEACE